MLQVLVIFETTTEVAKLLVLSVNREDFEKLERFDGHYINCLNTDEVMEDEINEFFYEDDGNFKFNSFVIKPNEKQKIRFDLIIQTGMME